MSHRALNEAVRSGIIERRGDWCRLLRDPVRSPRPWMEVVYTVLGEAHPTLTGRWKGTEDWNVFHVQVSTKDKPKVPPVADAQVKFEDDEEDE